MGSEITRVPLLDLKAQYASIKDDILRAVAQVFEEQSFVLGPQVASLEKDMRTYLGIAHALGVASGSDALLVALMALGVGPGDEVITTPYTFFATASAIWRLGARPVFVDIDPVTFNIQAGRLEGAITRNTRAIIPVHLYGLTADMDPILRAAKNHSLPVIEDAAQAIGAVYRGQKAGAIGDMGCFSFFPSKNLGGAGDGGMVVTPRADMAEKIAMLRVHGSSVRYRHDAVGINSRLDSVQAAVLAVKLRHLDSWAEGRRRNADRYRDLFRRHMPAGIVGLPEEPSGMHHVYNQFVIRVARRDEVKKHLADNGIITEIYYPIPMHLQPCFSSLGHAAGDFPEAEKASRDSLALPIYPELTPEMQDRVVTVMAEFFARA